MHVCAWMHVFVCFSRACVCVRVCACVYVFAFVCACVHVCVCVCGARTWLHYMHVFYCALVIPCFPSIFPPLPHDSHPLPHPIPPLQFVNGLLSRSDWQTAIQRPVGVIPAGKTGRSWTGRTLLCTTDCSGLKGTCVSPSPCTHGH